ncbi:MAG: TetR/AcrR family transcriptional regulator [Oscillospiraceae bacterium]|nr:TetR/AcrR family transcriptional regulator [Oscillospiraceae bacterium]
MNNSFLSLPDDKRTSIINAALRVFSQYGYKKSPINEIAAEAGISKSLLFYYFKNKKELYLYLLQYCAEIKSQRIKEQGCYDSENFFDAFTHSLKTITDMLRSYPECVIFELKAYYDNEPEVKADVSDFINSYSRFAYQTTNISITPDQFIEGLDLEMIYRNIYLACEGYLFEKISNGSLNADDMEHDYLKMIDHWKQIYLRRETSS